MKVLVTGASGRLGRSVVDGLADAGHEVVAADRVAYPAGSATRPASEHILDLADEQAVDALFSSERPEAVIHLAAIAVPFSAPERDILVTNTTLGFTVPAAALRHGTPRVLAASSPTIIGYGRAGWRASSVPLDETHPTEPWNAYALSKLVIEQEIAQFGRIAGPGGPVFGAFRPCYVISPEEWAGAPTQQGHTVAERLADPSLAAVSLFNYVDARDAGDFTATWIDAAPDLPQGEVFFVGAADALATAPVAELWRDYAPSLGDGADALTADEPVFSIAKADRLLGWRPTRSWRTELRPSTPTGSTA
ncbi:NAD-dependent epimerase/dehydratase family protein [Agromyces atrinae]|uniref:NAD(P)-dependent oxidoreductase n=1 Tax=Agromyces atrinae TaxID=592376 RepID=A0A4Q2M0K4_9MICO|nr:NAD(P)-dependent oxidoreductase [Agromyces atrinae]NYD67048.1 nucleoside-diphosphate-sugar epimerase [Agromyces atrinae]RXZ85228.1 NAD(P)-dependent oxidoreductase [Agromyces atrinae]RXZ85336.1 NAD(P)-dependent oxidoreductase [Agromyces atrinae]